jgi:hypothetical protein
MGRYTEQQIVDSDAVRRGLAVVQILQEGRNLLACLRIGHTRLMHGHLLQGDSLPLCVHCGLPLNVSHTLLKC